MGSTHHRFGARGLRRELRTLATRTVLAAALALAAAPALGQDVDLDGVADAPDNCPAWPNPAQADVDANGRGNLCECGDQSGDGVIDILDVLRINTAIFHPEQATELCDTNEDRVCDVRDVLGVSRHIFGTAETYCERHPSAPTAFLSADATPGEETGQERAAPGGSTGFEDTATPDASSERTVEEGDIYRVLGGSLILNLNAYRGLQVIDFSDVENPRIVGRARISGSPVEMYVVDETAYVLLNHWYGYYGTRGDVAIEQREGGAVVAVDLSDPTAPEITARAHVPGYIRTSRLTREGARAALYAASSGYAQWPVPGGGTIWESRTIVKSFEVSGGQLAARGEIDLGGYVSDVQGTPGALLVARNGTGQNHSVVSLIDISDPGGAMVEGGQVSAAGYVQSQFNMDLYRGVLRVVSTSWSTQTNTVQTFDASNLQDLAPLDSATFADGESLFATLFLGNKAFFVTYLRIDPFHAFEIGDDGSIAERAEFVVSGWNDFFRPVLEASRLVGIGINDESGRTLSVSLYDITELSNPTPLLDRADVEADSSWSEASWDHRAFSVIENAVSVPAPGGGTETGLVLLPFSGWNDSASTYTAAVQIFSFSEHSLTRRGLMVHGTQVRRSFRPADDLAANLSESELSLFDTSDVDAPVETGRVELAPNYTDLFVFGDHAARVKDGSIFHGWWGPRAELPPATVEIISREGDPETAPALTSFEVPSGAALHQTGDLLVSVLSQPLDTAVWPPEYLTTIQVWDLSDPTSPRPAGTLVTDRIQPSYGDYPYPYLDTGLAVDRFAPIPYPFPGGTDVSAVPDGLVFLQRTQQQERVGLEEVCYTYPQSSGGCWGAEGWIAGCTEYAGAITCRSLDGGTPWCSGELVECAVDASGERSCEPVDASGVPTVTSCWEYDRFRYWQSFALDVLDLADPDAPGLADRVDLGREQEGVSLLTDGSDAWVSLKQPVHLSTDARPYVRYHIVRVGLEIPASPVVDEPINTPGELLAIEGERIYTRDVVWGHRIAETALALLELDGDKARLLHKRIFEDQLVDTALLDGAGQLLVSHRGTFISPYGYIDYWSGGQQLTVLAAIDLADLASVPVDSFAQLRSALAGRAVFQVPGGVLVFNLDDPARPHPQAFFPTLGFPHKILVDAGQILIPAGRFGIHAFDLDAFNLLDPRAAGP